MSLASAIAELKVSLAAGNEQFTTKHFRLIIEALESAFSTDGGTNPETLFNLGRVRFSWLGFQSPEQLTVAAGVVTASRTYIQVDTEGAAATDELDTINGGEAGDLLVVRSLTSGRDVTLTDGVGNMILAGNCTLSDVRDVIVLIKRTASEWVEVCRSDNN